MKQFFSITIYHEYDKVSEEIKGVSNDLTVVPASSNNTLINNNRLFFRSQTGGLTCYIEDDETIINETDILYFWVVCINEAFYSYTEYPNHINFSKPYYYWSNSEGSTTLQQNEIGAKQLVTPPKHAIGCIGISVNNIDSAEQLIFSIDFKERKTYWEYHIKFKHSQKDWTYNIVDTIDEGELNEENKKWEFLEISRDNETITFRSKDTIAYSKKASNRLKLIWSGDQDNRFEEEQSMVLPFANYAYKMISVDNKELTPIYIYI